MSVQIIVGDCRKVLETLPSDSVDCIVTSPPYWGLRNYNVAGQIGMENSFSAWLSEMVVIFRELRRVLKPTGTCWLNCGDAYASTPNGRSAAASKAAGDDRSFRDRPVSTVGEFAAKQRMMMPARLAIALQDDGWWVRDEIIWHKPNPMPSSVKDRTTPAHEMVYLLTKRARYYYDYVAVMEPIAVASEIRYAQPTISEQKGGAKQDQYENGFTGQRVRSRRPNEILADLAQNGQQMRQRRSVWTIATQPMREAHFATFPEALVEPMILAGTSHRGCCRQCGKPWERVVDRHDRGWDGSVYGERAVAATGGVLSGGTAKSTLGSSNGKMVGEMIHLGWRPTCNCPRGRPSRPVVLDPFGGSGTVGLVADRHQRDAILIELNPEYAEIARQRIDAQRDTLFSAITVERRVPDADEPFEAAGRAGGDDPVAGVGDAAAADGL